MRNCIINTRLKVGSQILVLRKRFLTYSGSVSQQNRIVFAPDSPMVPNKLHGCIFKYILYSNIRSSRFKVRPVCIFSPTTFYSSFGSSHKFDSIEIIMFIYSLFFLCDKTRIYKHNNLNRLRLMGNGFGEFTKAEEDWSIYFHTAVICVTSGSTKKIYITFWRTLNLVFVCW